MAHPYLGNAKFSIISNETPHGIIELVKEADVITSTKRWMMDHCMYLIGDGWVGADPCDQGAASDWLSSLFSDQ